MIVRQVSELPQFDRDEPLVIDVETTSFDDKVSAFNPFQGHRMCGVAVCNLEGTHSWYVPVRHRDCDTKENLPIKSFQHWLKDLVESGRDIVNHNVKFDGTFWHFDGAHPKGQLIDTMVLGRLWKSDLPSLSLDALTGGNKDNRVKAYMKAIKSKDYGRCPISLMGPYAENDCIITARLYKKLMRELRDEVAGVWQTEIGLTRKLLEAQINGVRVDWVLLKHTYRDMLRRIMVVQEEMDKIAGREVEYGSEEEVNDLFVNQLGIQPVSYTDTGKNQWDSNAMDIIDHPIAPWFKEYSHLFHFTNTYCKGWIERRGDDDRLHPSFKQAGARTGRLSAVDPNFHNVMAEAEVFVIPEEGEVILGADYSQIEYRLFAHYANDEKILSKYRQDPNTDYHQALADLLGVDRQFAKSLNFAFLYGMGKDKLLKMIAGICAVNASDVNMADKMRSFLTGSGTSAANKARAMDLSSFTEIASNIYDKYHREVPTIRQLQRRVTNAVRSRGWLKNYCGRVYTIPPQAIYKGVNMLIQGSAADIFKGRLLALMEARPDMKLITNVHDSVFFSVARDGLEKALSDMILHLEDVPGVRVPLKIEAKVSGQNWGTCVKVSNDVWESVKKSEMVKKREWGKTA